MLFAPPPEYVPLVPTSEKEAQTWRYTTDNPGDGWQKAEFDDAKWASGPGGFGQKGTPGSVVRTEWTTKDIWARRKFELTEVPAGEVVLRVHFDEDAEVYVNGVLAAKLAGFATSYAEVPLSAAARKALKAGANVLAVRARNAGGGQYIDAGLMTAK
jgi:hypothetical protein